MFLVLVISHYSGETSEAAEGEIYSTAVQFFYQHEANPTLCCSHQIYPRSSTFKFKEYKIWPRFNINIL